MIKDTRQRLFEMMNKVAGMPILSEITVPVLKENKLSLLNEYEVINEINLETLFTDLENKLVCVSPDSFKEYLNFILKRNETPAYKREKMPLNKPWIHPSTIHMAGDPRLVKRRGKKGEEGKLADLKFRDVGSLNLSGEEYDEILDVLGDFDIERFIKEITQEPITIIDMNNKMAKSSTETSVAYNTGLPAFKGLVYDKNRYRFMYVSTCPGAGDCIIPCYARHGNYIQYPSPFLRATQILNYLLNEPELYEAKILRELEDLCKKHGNDVKVYMRWNDSGDFFTKVYYDIAVRVTNELTQKKYNVKSYAYTKVADVYINQSPNFLVTFSANANPIQVNAMKKAGLWNTAKTSDLLLKKYFDNLLIKKKNEKGQETQEYELDENKKVLFKDGWDGVRELKRRIAEEAFKQYNLEPESILTYEELLATPIKEGVVWNAVIMPTGDGDIAAQREDVKKIFLCQH